MAVKNITKPNNNKEAKGQTVFHFYSLYFEELILKFSVQRSAFANKLFKIILF